MRNTEFGGFCNLRNNITHFLIDHRSNLPYIYIHRDAAFRHTMEKMMNIRITEEKIIEIISQFTEDQYNEYVDWQFKSGNQRFEEMCIPESYTQWLNR